MAQNQGLLKSEPGFLAKGEGRGEGTVREFEMDMYTLLNLKWIINKDL